MTTRIYVTDADAAKYVGGTIRETEGKDITDATFQVGLSSSHGTPPSTWVTPSVNTVGASSSQRIIKLLIDDSTPPGNYTCWAKVVDTPEREPLVLQDSITVI